MVSGTGNDDLVLQPNVQGPFDTRQPRGSPLQLAQASPGPDLLAQTILRGLKKVRIRAGDSLGILG
jgi:hypothetical protein